MLYIDTSKTPHLLDSMPYCLTNGVQFKGPALFLCFAGQRDENIVKGVWIFQQRKAIGSLWCVYFQAVEGGQRTAGNRGEGKIYLSAPQGISIQAAVGDGQGNFCGEAIKPQGKHPYDPPDQKQGDKITMGKEGKQRNKKQCAPKSASYGRRQG